MWNGGNGEMFCWIKLQSIDKASTCGVKPVRQLVTQHVTNGSVTDGPYIRNTLLKVVEVI